MTGVNINKWRLTLRGHAKEQKYEAWKPSKKSCVRARRTQPFTSNGARRSQWAGRGREQRYQAPCPQAGPAAEQARVMPTGPATSLRPASEQRARRSPAQAGPGLRRLPHAAFPSSQNAAGRERRKARPGAVVSPGNASAEPSLAQCCRRNAFRVT